MFVRLLIILILIVISLFCWISFLNPLEVEFRFFGKTIPTDLSILMISSFILGVMLAFFITLTRDAKRAIESYQRSRGIKKAQTLKEEFNRGMEYFLRGNLTKAKTHFVEILKKDPSQIDLYFRLSEISVKEGNQEEALHWLERARLIDIRNVDILLREAELFHRMKRYDEAIQTLHRLIGLDEGNVKALKCLREIYRENRKWEEAIKTQKAILKLTKGKRAEEEETCFHLGLKYEYARSLMGRGGEDHLESALKEAKEIVRERKNFQPGFVLLGDIYLRKGRWASAGKVWGKSFTRFKSVIFLLRLEELYLSREDPDTLFRIYQRAFRYDPENWVIGFFYAKLCLRLEMLDEALEEINEISLRRKDFPALHRLLAEIYLHKKDFSKAAQEFEKTFELSRTSYLPFVCSNCKRESKEWVAYCPQCHQWSTYTIDQSEPLVDLPTYLPSEEYPFRLDAMKIPL
jgi:lipopolysaccharide biosynthesis regulator YciM